VKSTLLCTICLLSLLLAGCTKNIDNSDAVKAGIIKDIGKKVDVQNMDVNVDSVSFRDKEATANVSFRPKGGDPAQSITMTYNMVRQGDEWHVKERNMMRHEQAKPAAPGTLPPVTPGTPLPPGHPQMGGTKPGGAPGGDSTTTTIPIPIPVTPGAPQARPLPAGHPPLNSAQ
jgi:hypothetical protein